jgi:hypothetical protein
MQVKDPETGEYHARKMQEWIQGPEKRWRKVKKK